MTLNQRFSPLFLVLSGLFGFAGVALAAASAHLDADGRFLASASAMLIAHAPALLALALAGERLRTAWLAGLLMGVGTLLFAGDLVALRFAGAGLFPMAAPTGGFAMMFGWLAIAAGAFFRNRAR